MRRSSSTGALVASMGLAGRVQHVSKDAIMTIGTSDHILTTGHRRVLPLQ